MGGMKGTNSRAGAGDRSNRKTIEGTKAVKKTIGFNQTKHPTEGIVDSYALKSKKGGKGMYGSEASDATNNYLVSIGEAKVGNYFKQVGGKHIRLSKSEGEKLYKSGDTSVSRSYMVSSKGKEIKYGKSGGAMGSGDNTGIMGSIPISEQMFESQKKFKTIVIGALSLAVPGIGGSIMRAAAYGESKKKYNDYRSKFNENMSNPNFGSNTQASNVQSSSNLSASNTAMGSVNNKKENESTKFTKNIGRSFSDPNAKKRSLFQRT
tara:strand:+ start:624 stop:1415 length:792 start_codon:yes stop_codon:yes gene_type:complete